MKYKLESSLSSQTTEKILNFTLFESITVKFVKFHTQIDVSSRVPMDIIYLQSGETAIYCIPLKWKFNFFLN